MPVIHEKEETNITDHVYTLKGSYIDENHEYEYVGRLIRYKDTYYNGLAERQIVPDRDILMMLGKQTWFAWYKRIKKI